MRRTDGTAVPGFGSLEIREVRSQSTIYCASFFKDDGLYLSSDRMRYRKEIPMSDDLATLETQRSKLLEEFLGLGDRDPVPSPP